MEMGHHTHTRGPASPSMRPKAIDLFAGPGGLSLGLERAGFDVLAAIEWDEAAGETYRTNFDHPSYQRDISKLAPMELRKTLEREKIISKGERISLIAGGPPCPGFSLIGRSKISDLIKKGEYGESKEYRHRFIDDPRNQLFREFVKYVKEFQPDYFLMENVSGMTSYVLDEDPIVDVICASFVGYEVKWRVLDASEFGVPQSRKRIFFIGSRTGNVHPEFPEPTHTGRNKISTLEAILDLSLVKPTSNGLIRVRDPQGSNTRGFRYRSSMRQWKIKGVRQSLTGRKTSHWSRSPNERDMVIFPLIKSGAPAGKASGIKIPPSEPRQIYGDIFPHMWNSHLKPAFEDRGMRAWKRGRYHVEAVSGKRWVMYDPKGFSDKMRRIRWDEPSPTIVAHLAKDAYMFIHPWHNRTISVREAARIQSFPDSFEFKGSMTDQYRQVGNAVPPLLAFAIGTELILAISSNN